MSGRDTGKLALWSACHHPESGSWVFGFYVQVEAVSGEWNPSPYSHVKPVLKGLLVGVGRGDKMICPEAGEAGNVWLGMMLPLKLCPHCCFLLRPC